MASISEPPRPPPLPQFPKIPPLRGEAVCEVSACNSHSSFFNDAPACVESCSSHDFMAKETACSLAKLDKKECTAALTCEESEALSEAIINGEIDVETDDWACKAEDLEVAAACP